MAMARYGNFGASDGTSFQETAQVLKALTSDPYRQVQVLSAHLKKLKSSPRFPGRDMLIADFEARLRAAKRQVKLQTEGEEATRDWRALGQASIAGIVVVSLAATYFLIKRAQ